MKRNFTAIAVVGGKNGVIEDIFPPCGVCRQVMQEFCGPDFMIYMGRSDDSYVAVRLEDFLPYGFSAGKYMKETQKLNKYPGCVFFRQKVDFSREM